jgi:putative phage-type endonuclease
MTREEWLVQRRKTLGGSDAAGIIGLSKWSSPYSVWADKTGRLPDKPDNEAMRQGRDLEDYVARRWMEATGKKVRRLPAMLHHPAYPFAHADVDRMVQGEDAGLECKTTSALDIKQFKGVDFPEKYYAQCVHYMAVTGCQRWYLAVLVFGRGFFHFTLERDQAEIDALMGAEADFWKLVEADTPPVLDGTEATGDALQTIYRDSQDSSLDLFGRETILQEYTQLKQQKKDIDERMGEIENIIKGDMKEAERAVCGGCSVLWKSQTRHTFQAKAFSQDHPEIDLAPYYKASTSRPFKITETEECT